MNTRRVYSQTQIREIAEKLSALKAHPKPERSMSASGAIALLIGEIKALQARGYSIADIADLLRENDLPVSAATLKSAIARAQSTRQSRPRVQAQSRNNKAALKNGDQVASPSISQTQPQGSFDPLSDTDEI
ncbi:hypothetical protein [Thauera humireducens]|uniref:hypothetical protein n=1 Tax=Thauera humireducens TaxID=1134435 RepID=UPI00312046C6